MDFALLALMHVSWGGSRGQMNVKEYVLRRLNEGETDLNVLLRQALIQFPSGRIGFSYVRKIRNEWRKTSAVQEPTLSDSPT
jgi:hypothetical protein